MISIPTDNVDFSGDVLIYFQYNSMASELLQMISSSAQAIDAGSVLQLAQAVARYSASGGFFHIDTGVSNAYSVTQFGAYIEPTEIIDGARVMFKASSSNTGPSTLTWNNSVTHDIKRHDGSDLAANDIIQNQIVTMRWNEADDVWYLIASSSALKSTTQSIAQAQTGSMSWFAGASAPNGWLLCDGSQYDPLVQPDLFSAIGTQFNTGGESPGFFRVPDLRGRTAPGVDNMGGGAAGRLTGAGGVDGSSQGNSGGSEGIVLTVAEIPSHTHTGLNPDWALTRVTGQGSIVTPFPQGTGAVWPTGTTGGDQPHNNMDASLVLTSIIKA